MKDLRHPAKSLYQNELNLEDEIIASEEDYHMVTGANRQLRRQILQNAQFSYDTTGSHASQDTSTSTKTQFDPNNQMAIAIKKTGYSQPLLFHPKTTSLPPSPVQETVGEPSGTTHWTKRGILIESPTNR